MERIISAGVLEEFEKHLAWEEKSTATIEKYRRDAEAFCRFVGTRPVNCELVQAWKQDLLERGYAVRSINSMLASVNSLLSYLGWSDCRVKILRIQRRAYCEAEKELTKGEYMRLLEAARGKVMYFVMQTICATGIRVSELRYFTVEALEKGEITIRCKGKIRSILLPRKLCRMLSDYARRQGIYHGTIFLGRSGKPLDRSSIWAQMKRLCDRAGVERGKVFPHNLRKLFARTFHAIEKDIAKLADILGHSSIETTRIYIMTSGREHRRKMERLGLMV